MVLIRKIQPNHKTKLSNKIVTKTKSKNGLIIGIGSAFIVLSVITVYFSGYLSYFIDAYPLIEIGEHTTTLTCDYTGKKLTTDVKTYTNVDTYYKYRSSKNSIVTNGDYKKLATYNQADNTIKNLAENIKNIGEANNLNDDQTVELATCFIQNIPYDNDKATIVLSGGNISNYDHSQFPYETLFKNSGICTDKTYLGSALISELGYGTGIMMFPDAQHMALGIEVPSGYEDFNTKYAYMEMTNTGFAPGEVPSEINDANGTAAVSINSIADLDASQDPTKVNISSSGKISAPNLVIDVKEGNKYQRIIAIRQLENKIVANLDALIIKKTTLNNAYWELGTRDNAQSSAYSTYLSTPDTKLDCGYKYDYSYSYSYSYPYSYSSPYKYSCDTITNPDKSRQYTLYSIKYNSYKSQYNYYGELINDYNISIASLKAQINSYKQYDYN